jgi:hypothetical protein
MNIKSFIQRVPEEEGVGPSILPMLLLHLLQHHLSPHLSTTSSEVFEVLVVVDLWITNGNPVYRTPFTHG